IDDTPDLFRRLAAAGITTREACGNTVRNVTACPIAGVCRDETFDVTPYAKACARFLLGHKDTQDFGRKFKIAFSGCAGHACGLAMMHDMGCIARKRIVDGVEKRGFEFYVGGGLGAVPYQAKLFDEFLPVEELLPVAQAMARVFARLGEKKNRAAARLKFLVKKLGIGEFKRLVIEERAALPSDPKWTDWLGEAEQDVEHPLRGLDEPPVVAGHPVSTVRISPFEKWCSTNAKPQRQPGYVAVTVTLPLGDISSSQMRKLSDIVRKYLHDTIRTTVEQNLLLRWIRESDLPALYRDLEGIGLNEPGAESIVDVTACPGTDTCKLGIASSRGLAAVLREKLMTRELQYDEAVRNMRIKVSGCFNSCGQHHLADIGFYGSSRTIGGFTVPHFQLLLGGEWSENAAHYGLSIGALPSKRIPEVVDRLIERYMRERQSGENFRVFMGRLGKKEAKAMLDDLTMVPAHDADPSFFVDWHDSREFSIGDMGKGECAGEVVSMFDFDLAEAEREVFEAQIELDGISEDASTEEIKRHSAAAIRTACKAMISAAHALNRIRNIDSPADPARVVEIFRRDFYDTQIFFDRFAGGRFAQFLFQAHERGDIDPTPENAHQRVEEAQLFIEASHACQMKIVAGQAPAVPSPFAPGR
ncbi:MAG: nitrite/sulfite reductase, partial [Candidatus Hydrogenedentota bacterium]